MNSYRDLPSVDRLLTSAELQSAASELGLEAVTQAARDELSLLRDEMKYRGSEEALLEDAEANGHHFDREGKIG